MLEKVQPPGQCSSESYSLKSMHDIRDLITSAEQLQRTANPLNLTSSTMNKLSPSHIFKQLAIYTLGASASLALVACESDSDKIQAKWNELQAAANSAPIPSKRFEIYSQQFHQTVGRMCLRLISSHECFEKLDSYTNQANEQKVKALVTAIETETGKPLEDALEFASTRWGDSWAISQRDVVQALVARAQTPNAPPIVVYHAGKALSEGTSITRDSASAEKFLHETWTKYPQAANFAALNALQIGDIAGAYRWYIRCTDPCIRNEKLASVGQKLGPKNVAEIEAQERQDRAKN